MAVKNVVDCVVCKEKSVRHETSRLCHDCAVRASHEGIHMTLVRAGLKGLNE